MPPYRHPKSGAWTSDFRATDPTTGTRLRYRRALGDARTRAEAEAAERALQAMIEAGRDPAGAPKPAPVVVLPSGRPSAPFSAVAGLWIDTVVAVKRKPSYLRTSESACATWLVPHFGHREVSTISSLDVERLQAAMRTTIRSTKARRPPGPKTVNNVIGVLSSILGAAVRWGYIEDNPVEDVEPLPSQRDPRAFPFYTAPQSDRWLETCRALEPSWHPLFLVGFRTGLRLGELFALEPGDVNLTDGVVHVRRSVADHTDEVTAPKSGQARVVDLSPQAIAVLRSVRRVGVRTVFADLDGRRLNRDMLKHPWERVTAASALHRIRPHDMRHSYASQLVIAGTPLKVVQEQLGHATIEMTMRYAHLAPGAARSYVHTLDGLATPLATPELAATVAPPKARRKRRDEEVEAAGVEPAAKVRRW